MQERICTNLICKSLNILQCAQCFGLLYMPNLTIRPMARKSSFPVSTLAPVSTDAASDQ